MAKARLMYRNLSKSNKYNDLYKSEHGELAQNIYTISYSYSDDWGHLPYDARWIKNECMPESIRMLADISSAMESLVITGLWQYVYKVEGKKYIYIYNFEPLQRDGIRHRRRGEYPGEYGQTPERRLKDKKPIKIDECLEESRKTRLKYTNSEMCRNVSRNPD